MVILHIPELSLTFIPFIGSTRPTEWPTKYRWIYKVNLCNNYRGEIKTEYKHVT